MTAFARTHRILKGLAASALLLLVSASGAMAGGTTVYKVDSAFDDVSFGLESAIIDRGLVIDYVSHIGEMLARTKEDVGGTRDLYSNAIAMVFCSANLSRKMMEADPANIAYCPYVVFAYEMADEPGMVHVGFRRLDETGTNASKAALGEVNALLNAIVKEAAEG